MPPNLPSVSGRGLEIRVIWEFGPGDRRIPERSKSYTPTKRTHISHGASYLRLKLCAPSSVEPPYRDEC